MGRLGLQKAADTALPAHVSSLISAMPTVESIVPESRLSDQVAELWSTARWSTATGKGTPPVEDQARQSSWTKMGHAQASESLLENANVITQARLLASSSTESAAWLAALPVSTFGNLLDDPSLRISVHLRLGASTCGLIALPAHTLATMRSQETYAN